MVMIVESTIPYDVNFLGLNWGLIFALFAQ